MMNEQKPKAMKQFNSGIHPSAPSVCVYCGSGPGTDPAYINAARELGKSLAEAGLGLVYGGGSLGLMGETARAALDHGAPVTGIIPEFLTQREKMLEDVTHLHVVDDMHVRKQMMFEASDAFVALPGGIGTLEELVEQLTWSQLGRHTKPIVIANVNGFWDPFLELLAHMRSQEFIRQGLEVGFQIVNEARDVVPAILTTWQQQKSAEPVADRAAIAKL